MPLIGTRGAASSRGFGFAGLRLISVTLPAGTSTWVAPSGVSKLVSAIGKGADGTAGYWNPSQLIGYSYPVPNVGSGGSILDWSTVYSDANALLSAANAGGTGNRFITETYYLWPLYSDNTAGARGTLTYPGSLIRGTATLAPVPSGTPTSGQVIFGSPYNYWGIYCEKYNDPTTGSSTTAFSLSFPGGNGAPATNTTYNNISITPGASYTIQNNGALTITYLA